MSDEVRDMFEKVRANRGRVVPVTYQFYEEARGVVPPLPSYRNLAVWAMGEVYTFSEDDATPIYYWFTQHNSSCYAFLGSEVEAVEAFLKLPTSINTHGLRIDFGKHGPQDGQPGELWTRVPVGYLKWIVNEPNMADERKEVAQAELERRGTVTPTIEVSGHAIDRASLSLRKTWHLTAVNKDEGLHAWLCRVAAEALERGEPVGDNRIVYLGMRFAFEHGDQWPVLKTVMRIKSKDVSRQNHENKGQTQTD